MKVYLVEESESLIANLNSCTDKAFIDEAERQGKVYDSLEHFQSVFNRSISDTINSKFDYIRFLTADLK